MIFIWPVHWKTQGGRCGRNAAKQPKIEALWLRRGENLSDNAVSVGKKQIEVDGEEGMRGTIHPSGHGQLIFDMVRVVGGGIF